MLLLNLIYYASIVCYLVSVFRECLEFIGTAFFSSFDYTLLTFASSMLNEIKRNIMSIVAVE